MRLSRLATNFLTFERPRFEKSRGRFFVFWGDSMAPVDSDSGPLGRSSGAIFDSTPSAAAICAKIGGKLGFRSNVRSNVCSFVDVSPGTSEILGVLAPRSTPTRALSGDPRASNLELTGPIRLL